MMFTKRLRMGIRLGRIRCSIRIWKSPRVKAGGRYPMDEGQIVEEGTPDQIFANPQQQRTKDFLNKVL